MPATAGPLSQRFRDFPHNDGMLNPCEYRFVTISIIIATKNRPGDIVRCLGSIASQSRLPDQVIVVDQSVRPYQLHDLRGLVHVHDAAIKGAAAARNVGLQFNTCDIVFFIDDDVELLHQTVEKLLAAFEAAPDAIGMQCIDRVRHHDGRSTSLLENIFSQGFFSKRSIWKGTTEYRRWLAGYAMAFRKKLFESEIFDDSLFRYSFGEDWELSQRAKRYGTLQVAHGADVLHHQSPVNRESSRALQRLRWQNYHYFYDKLGASRSPINKLALRWWELGEAYAWLRNGMGLPWSNVPTKQTTAALFIASALLSSHLPAKSADSVPRHVLTAVQNLCYQTSCYKGRTGVSIRDASRVLTWAQVSSTNDADAARAAGIKVNLYIDPSIQYGPPDYAPLLTAQEATFLHDCSGRRVTVRQYNLTGYVMDVRSPSFVSLFSSWVKANAAGHYDAIFVDDAYFAVNSYLPLSAQPCGITREGWRSSFDRLVSTARVPAIVNSLAMRITQDGTGIDSLMQKAYEAPDVVGAMYELCYTEGSGQQGDWIWRAAENSEITSMATKKLWFCFGTSTVDAASSAGIEQRLFQYASFLLTYDPRYAIWQTAFKSPRNFNVLPETRLVALEPKRAQPVTIDDLSVDGLYVREFAACFIDGESRGPCAAVVNPSKTRTVPFRLAGYGHTLSLRSSNVFDPAGVSSDGPPPTTAVRPLSAFVAFR